MTDPTALTLIAAVAYAYALGVRRRQVQAGQRVVTSGQQAAFAAGLVVTALAVASPLDTVAERSLSAHMVQHVLLLSASGPLLAFGAPVPTLLFALPERLRRPALRWSRRVNRNHDRWQPGWVAAGLVAEAAVVLGWHLPLFYDAALRHPLLHDVEHLSFVVTATLSWWTVVTGRRSRRGAAAVAALVGSMSGIILGSAMVIAPNPFYSTYVHSTVAAALDDQRMAGVIMWAFGGLLDDLTGAALFASWLSMAREPAEESYAVPPLPGAVS